MTVACILTLLLVLLVLRVPVALAMSASAIVGFGVLGAGEPLLVYLKTAAFWRFSSYSLSVVPLFILMGQFASHSGLSQSMFRAAQTAFGHKRGGGAIAAIIGCAGFAAICGSSLATAAAMGKVALPELRKAGYEGGFAAATLATGGTLGILIPPSIVLVLYAIITEANIAKLFIAALVPGLLAAASYALVANLHARRNPQHAPPLAKALPQQRRKAMQAVLPALAAICAVVGGLYLGWFTPTEAAAVGTGIVATHYAFSGTWKERLASLKPILLETASTSAMIFLILLGADLLSAFLSLAAFPQDIAASAAEANLSPYVLLLLTMLLLIVLGCFMDSLSIVFLIVPLVFPVLSAQDFAMPYEEFQLWFGIIALIIVEMGLITPPVGLNCMIIHRLANDVSLGRIFRASMPYLASDLVRILILLLFPSIVLFLPRLMDS